METSTAELTILDAATTTGPGATVNVKQYDFVTILLSFAAASTATAKIQGSAQQDEPDFGAAQATANHWDYVDAIDAQNEISIDGDTGLAVSSATDVRTLRVDTRSLSWLTVNVTARSAGSVSAKAVGFDIE